MLLSDQVALQSCPPVACTIIMPSGASSTSTASSMAQQPQAEMLTSAAAVAGVQPARPFRDPAQNPAFKLTVGLLDTYKRINEHYYEAKRKRQEMQGPPASSAASSSAATDLPPCDDAENDYIIVPGDVLNKRYRIEKKIGKGSFGQVVLAIDLDQHPPREVAVKIIKSKKPFTKQADTEIKLLKRLNAADTTDKGCVVKLLDTFMHRNHRCLVFEKLSMNLYDLLRSTGFQGVSFDLIRKFARQILQALRFFAEVDIIHCDLKPENILLVEQKRSALKVIDFGSSCTSQDKPYTYIQSRFYRSPEVILGCGYTTAIDMWSLGCILIEMHSGEPLFSGQNENEQVHLLVGSRGYPPEDMLTDGKKVSKFFDVSESEPNNTKRWTLKELKDRLPDARPLKPLTIEQALGIAPGSDQQTPFLRPSKHRRESRERYMEFADLLNQMLCYSPAQRITPAQALAHPFLASMYVPGGASGSGVAPPPPPPPSSSNNEGGKTTTARRDPPKRPFSQ